MTNTILPVLMRPDEIISLKEAVFRTGKNEKTIRRWCKEDGIGRRTAKSAPWEISAIALEAKLYGDYDAIDKMRESFSDCDAASRYRSHLGMG